MTSGHPRSAKDVVEELFRRQKAGDDTVLDDLVAPEMVDHAAGPRAAMVCGRSCVPSRSTSGRPSSSSTT
jgi:hypothetical protein